MLRKTTMSVTALAFLAACADSSGQGGITQRQGLGALSGAAVGAALGTLVGGDDRRNALVGAGIGLIAGAAVGTYLDEQERRLNQSLAGTGADVQRVNDTLLVTLPAGVTFDVDSDKVKGRFRRPLQQVARTLVEYPSSYVDVIGHTDSTGSASHNQDLSERRAEAVRNVLVRNGVQPQRVVAYGYGETQPIASNATAEGRAANRRVEIVITPATRS